MSRARERGFAGLEGVALYAVVGLGVALLLSWAGAGLALKWLDGKVEAANERATEAEAARASEEQSRKGFQAASASCSASVERLAAAGARRDALWAAQLTQSHAKTEAAQAEAEKIRNSARPVGMTECQAMIKELDSEIDRRQNRR